MHYEIIDLYEQFHAARGERAGTLAVYAPAPNPELAPKARPSALVIPGGGYGMVSSREGEPVCLRLLSEGFAVFCLTYTTNTPFPAPLIEAAMAAAFIRKHAKRYGLNAEKLCVFGFSAGGHLAAMLSTMFACEEVKAALKEDAPLARPDAAVLSYPVITTEKSLTHGSTANVISGGDDALRARLSLERAVKADSVPAFLWHTAEDGLVPAENSLLLAEAYRRANVPFELHIFERGVHGLSLADGETSEGRGTPLFDENAQAWFPLALAWLRLRGFCVR